MTIKARFMAVLARTGPAKAGRYVNFCTGPAKAGRYVNQLLFRERELAHARARGGEDRVAQRREHRRQAGLADTGRQRIAVHEVDVHLVRRIRHARNLEVVEVALLDATADCRDLAQARQADRHDRGAFHLRPHAIRD